MGEGAQWRVLRQDDYGNVFVVADRLSQGQAEALALEYERKGHKQLYWAAPSPSEQPAGG